MLDVVHVLLKATDEHIRPSDSTVATLFLLKKNLVVFKRNYN